jgi:hypothetical protein
LFNREESAEPALQLADAGAPDPGTDRESSRELGVSQPGQARRLAPLGRRPRYSPDGKWIAYWVGTDALGVQPKNPPLPGAFRMYVVAAEGGEPREIRSDFAAAGYPVWTPDGVHLLFLGNRDPNQLAEPSDRAAPALDWWVTPLGGGPAVTTGANAVFRSAGLPSSGQAPEAWTADGDGVLYSAAVADTHNLSRIPISSADWKVKGAPRRLTFGTGLDVSTASEQ